MFLIRNGRVKQVFMFQTVKGKYDLVFVLEFQIA